jgi:hypothetical protein
MAATSTASKTATDVTRKAEEIALEASARLVRRTKDAANRSLEARRSQAEAYFDDVGRAMDAAAEQLSRDDHHMTAHYVHAAARQSRRLAKSVDPTDLRVLVERAEEFIRARPIVTTVAGVALGFATMQALRATTSAPSTSREGSAR